MHENMQNTISARDSRRFVLESLSAHFLFIARRARRWILPSVYVCEAVGLPTTPESTEKKSLLRLHTGDVYKRCFGQITDLTLSNWSELQRRAELNLRIR